MKKITIICLFFSFLLAVGCKKENKEFIVTKFGEIEIGVDSDSINLSKDYFGTYAGAKSCSQCGKDIEIYLTLNQNNTYSLKVEEHHQWVLTKGSYTIDGDIVKLDNEESFKYKLEDGELYLISPQMNSVSHIDFSYSLNKVK